MTLRELNEILINSNSNEWIYDDDFGLYVYENDIDITITSDRNYTSGCQDERFYEQWATRFPDDKAYRSRFLIKYRGNLILSIIGAQVDGYRCFIPYPRLSDMTINEFEHSLGEIINNCIGPGRDYESYLRRSGITVREE